MNIENIDALYAKYGYRRIESLNSIKLYLYEKGRYYGADIIQLNDSEESEIVVNKLKTEYANGGYAVRVKKFSSEEDISLELYRSFFSYDIMKKRIKSKYSQFVSSQTRLNGGNKYEYINTSFKIDNEVEANSNLIEHILNRFKIDRPQLIIIEGSAGYGKTCTAFEVLKILLDTTYCQNPLMTTLSRNRGANIFRYILLDEIDREYPSLDSHLVTFEIHSGKIPLIIDGFDELLNKSEIVKIEKDKAFGEVETMLDTIGHLLKEKARIILTSRKTALFAGQEFELWLSKWKNSFDVTRFSIETPKIKDWLINEKYLAIKNLNIPLEYIANPVLLTYLRNLDMVNFKNHISEPDTIIKKYFNALLEREIIRQELKISAEDQYKIFKNVANLLIKFDFSTTDRKFFKEIILDENQRILEQAIKLYGSDKNMEWLAEQLATHALLDRKGKEESEIGFINDFVFGTFVGEILSESAIDELNSFSSYMIEIGATAYRVQNSANKTNLWNKIEAIKEKFDNVILFSFDTTLKSKLERNYSDTIFQNFEIYKITFTEEFTIKSSVFINCTFKNCVFNQGAFDSVSFINCVFVDCNIIILNSISDYANSFTIKCRQENCFILPYLKNPSEVGIKNYEDLENKILKELYSLEKKHKNQRLLFLMKKFSKADKKLISQLIDKLISEKIIKVIGLDAYIEINKIQIVKNRINNL